MAPSLMRVLKQLAGEMVLYCPDAKESDFHSALAYLIRRLDENCGSDNFLRHFFALKPGNAIWQEETKRFKEGFSLIDTLPEQPRRKQSRLHPIRDAIFPDLFVNEPDTDFSLKDNREWIDQIYTEWKKKKHPPIPLAIGGEDMITVLEQGFDPSLPGSSSYMYSLADIPLVEKAISCAEKNLKHWSELPLQQKKEIFWQVAQVFRKKRGELIGVMIADGGKTAREADPEVSEAIDFLDYYTRNWEEMLAFQDICWKPKGIVLIAPPWNFPCSIPVSGIAAALLAGNCVIFKPAPETPLVGWHVVQAFWEGGVPKEILQMINCKEEPIGNYLIKHPKLASVILTGSSQTARTFLNLHPGLDLHAETGGKNAIIVTAMCDRDLAIRDIISSAFGHSGQKCSACSLAILEAEIYDDLNFQERLLDAANSLKVASAWDKSAKITPLIKPPEGALKRGLTTLEAGESWLLQPKENSENPHLWSPGIKWGVQKKGFTHQTELFGPVLGVMRAKNLDDAIELANGTPYGLTSGLHTLDEREQQKWKQRIIAGNLYINRGITGAIVKRQPFGGCKASSFGSGGKAGGPNYVLQFAHLEQLTPPRDKGMLPSNLVSLISILSSLSLSKTEKQAWKTSVESYAYWAPILKAPKDPAHLQGQHNFFYHIPLEKVHVRIDSSENLLPLLQVIAACLICQTSLEISTPHPLPKLATIPGIKIVTEGEAQLFDRKPARIRLLSPPSIHLKQQAAKNMIMLHCQPVLANGRFELLHYLREITLSIDYHRYGYFA
jgi:RHH-type proline utilization regulon transcriptional repressor/proline dehydrogenase/delta 1-pyrroline-5-carboxylate dehydrogenase